VAAQVDVLRAELSRIQNAKDDAANR